MASYNLFLLAGALFLLAAVQTGLSIRCHVCNSNVDGKACEDPFNTTALQETCDVPNSICLKHILPALGKYPEITSRGCVEESYCKNSDKSSKHCSTCKKELCNSALTVSPHLTGIFGVCYVLYSVTR